MKTPDATGTPFLIAETLEAPMTTDRVRAVVRDDKVAPAGVRDDVELRPPAERSGSFHRSIRTYRHQSGRKQIRVASFHETKAILDAIYASGRLRLPFEGVLLFGY